MISDIMASASKHWDEGSIIHFPHLGVRHAFYTSTGYRGGRMSIWRVRWLLVTSRWIFFADKLSTTSQTYMEGSLDLGRTWVTDRFGLQATESDSSNCALLTCECTNGFRGTWATLGLSLAMSAKGSIYKSKTFVFFWERKHPGRSTNIFAQKRDVRVPKTCQRCRAKGAPVQITSYRHRSTGVRAHERCKRSRVRDFLINQLLYSWGELPRWSVRSNRSNVANTKKDGSYPNLRRASYFVGSPVATKLMIDCYMTNQH